MKNTTCHHGFERMTAPRLGAFSLDTFVWVDHCVLLAEHRFLIVSWCIILLLAIGLVIGCSFNVFNYIRYGRENDDVDQTELKKLDRSESAWVRKVASEVSESSKTSIRNGVSHWSSCVGYNFRRQFGVHTDDVVGVGLALFYNDFALPAVAAISACILSWCFVQIPEIDLESFKKVGELQPVEGSDNVDGVDLFLKATLKSTDSWDRFKSETRLVLALLYFIMLVHAWLHAWVQSNWARHFDASHSTMKDYAVQLDDVPKSETNARKLTETIVDQLRLEPKDVVGVSIGYNLRDQYDGTTAQLENVFAKMELREQDADPFDDSDEEEYNIAQTEDYGPDATGEHDEGSEDSDGSSGSSAKCTLRGCFSRSRHATSVSPVTSSSLRKRHHGLRQGLLPDGSHLACSGRAYLVFNTKAAFHKTINTHSGFWLHHDALVSKKTQEAIEDSITGYARCGGVIKDEQHHEHRRHTWRILQQTVHMGDDEDDDLPAGSRVRFRGNVDPTNKKSIENKESIEYETFVKISKTHSEPPCIHWYDLGPPMERRVWCRKVILSVLLFLLLFAVLWIIYDWFLQHIVHPYARVGLVPQPMTGQFRGIIIGIVNNVLGIVVWQCLSRLNFDDHDTFDNIIYPVNLLVGALNDLCNMAAILDINSIGGLANMIQSRHDVVVFRKNWLLADQLERTLVPGWLFSGFLIGQMMGTVMPLVQGLVMLKIIYQRSIPVPMCITRALARVQNWPNPDEPDPAKPGKFKPVILEKRKAELILEPMGLGLAWDFLAIQSPTMLCMMTLFLQSTKIWHTFPWLLVYIIFVYIWHRFVVLNVKKRQMHSSDQLHCTFIKLWGIPLSMVAMAWALWAYRCEMFAQFVWIPGVGVFSLLLYWYGLTFIEGFHGTLQRKQHYELDTDLDYFAASERRGYDWFNTNPIHVLKSNFNWADLPEASKAECPFFYGKEYFWEKHSLRRRQKRTKFSRTESDGSMRSPEVDGLETACTFNRPRADTGMPKAGCIDSTGTFLRWSCFE